MDKQFEGTKHSKCIEVKGMNGLSLPYIQRFFSHVGPVEQAKKIQDLVLVRFKNQSSVNKALRFCGRVIDKQPIKIRTATVVPNNTEQAKINRKPSNLKCQLEMYEKLDEVIRNRAFDITFYWVNILKIINKLQDDRSTWLLHEIFFIKLSQVIHFHAFGTNPRSCYSEISIKQNFLHANKNNIKLTKSEGSIEKLEILSIPSNQLLDQANYECFLSNVDTKLKQRFQQLLKSQQSTRLYQLYQIMNSYSIHIPADQSIFTNQTIMSNNPFSISKELVTKNRARISFQDPKEQKRSEYRQIDNSHPSKEIEILSDSYLNEKIFEYTTYDVFRDDFDGNINNNCAVDVFFHLKVYFAANYIIVRCRELSKMHYFRLDFELRLMNCEGEVLGGQNFAQYYEYLGKQATEVPEIKLSRHSLVISDFQNTEKTIYLIQHYVRFFLPESSMKLESQTTQNLLTIMAIETNPSQTENPLSQIWQQMEQNEVIRRSGPKLYSIKIWSPQKFEKQKCRNFVEEYMEEHKNPYNLEISKLHARRIIDENPSKFKHIPNIEEFITQSIWKLEQEKSKKQAKYRIKAQLQNIRMG